MNNPPSTEDRVWAVLSHLSSLAFGMGIFLPIVGWADQRRKSNYAAFQCLQALGYQSLGFTIWILSFLLICVAILIVMVASSFQAEKAGINFNPFFGAGTILLFIFVFGFLAIYFFLPIIGAIACGLGKEFRYPILGERLGRYLQYEPSQETAEHTWLEEDHEYRWVAAMGHFSVLILIWGVLAPLTTWILYGKGSPFLKFQSIQTLVYQAGANILYFVGGFIYMFGFLILLAVTGIGGQPNFDSPAGIFPIIIFGLSLLIAFILFLVVPLLHILGQWAGYRVLKSGNYYYPVLGKLVERVVSKTPLVTDRDVNREGGPS